MIYIGQIYLFKDIINAQTLTSFRSAEQNQVYFQINVDYHESIKLTAEESKIIEEYQRGSNSKYNGLYYEYTWKYISIDSFRVYQVTSTDPNGQNPYTELIGLQHYRNPKPIKAYTEKVKPTKKPAKSNPTPAEKLGKVTAPAPSNKSTESKEFSTELEEIRTTMDGNKRISSVEKSSGKSITQSAKESFISRMRDEKTPVDQKSWNRY